MEISQLRELQNHFEAGRVSTPEAQQLFKQSEELTSQFQQKFNRDKLRSMTLQEYVVGYKNRDSFCYWLQYKTSKVGEIFVGGAALSFGVYYSKPDGAYKIPEGDSSKVVSEDDAVKQLEKIKAGLIEILNFAERKDFAEMWRVSQQLPIDLQVIGKILTLYFPDKYLGVFSNRHVDKCLEEFGLIRTKITDLNIFEKRAILLDFKEKDAIMKNWGNRKYVDFLYKEILRNEPAEVSYFILRTGGGDYADKPETKYNFKEGIPGSNQLRSAENNGRFVYLEKGAFYGKGRIGKIAAYDKEGTTYYNAEVIDYEKIGPVQFDDTSSKLGFKSIGQAGILKISEADFKTIIESKITRIKAAPSIEQLSLITFIPKEQIQEWEMLLEERKQIIFYGPPGTGKTFVAENFTKYFVGNNGKMELVQFHPSYSYEDFVEGIRPKIATGTTQVTYEFSKGILKELCDLAIEKPERRFVLLIDEINRGNIAKIFGELIHCLEYRGENHKVLLPYTQKHFYMPNNLYIIGTMNSADRSIALVDYALRRRFCFIDFMPDEQILRKWLDQNNITIDKDKIIEFLHKINQKIRDDEKLGKHFQIGHSYFMREKLDQKELERIWKYNILPLLEEYYFEDEEAIKDMKKTFGDVFSPAAVEVDVSEPTVEK